MIHQALQFTKDILDQFLKNQFDLDESKVLLNNIIDTDGTIPSINKNKVVVSLINVEKETNKPFYGRNQKTANTNYADINPYERYNLDLLVSSNFENYSETLKFLAASILFFQIHPGMDSSLFSSIPAGLHKLEFDIERITYHEMHSLWTAMGAKYQPSVIYKMRLVTIQGGQALGYTPGVAALSNSTLS